MIWKLKSAPELAALSCDEADRLVREACASQSVRRSSLMGLILCGLCAGAGSWIGDVFSAGIYGSGIGGGVGGFIYFQVRMRAIVQWIRMREQADTV